MPMFIVTEAAGLGAGDIDSAGTFVDLAVIANETGLGLDPEIDGRQLVTYTRTLAGPPQLRLDELVNTDFRPDYGAGPQDVDIVIVSVPDDFVFGDGSFGVVDNGTALPPTGSGLGGDTLNPTVNCLVLYDTQLEICGARDGTGGTLDLPFPGPATLYHELSHARRIVRNELLALGGGCDPASPEEHAAITEENDMRRQLAVLLSLPEELRDPDIHCAGPCAAGGGSCCIVATLVTGSDRSTEVQRLRQVRDSFLRATDVGHDFFATFFHDYYSFSPQVCTMIAGLPEAREAVRTGFVEPLLDFWRFMAARAAFTDATDHDLGSAFLDQLPPDRPARLAALLQTAAAWEEQRPEHGDLPAELFALLRERAWPSPSIQWAIIEPLRIYADVLASACADVDDVAALGRRLRRLLDEWTPAVPLTETWGALDAAQLARELAVCETALLQTAAARRAFRERLSTRFRAVSAIRAATGAGQPESEGRRAGR